MQVRYGTRTIYGEHYYTLKTAALSRSRIRSPPNMSRVKSKDNVTEAGSFCQKIMLPSFRLFWVPVIFVLECIIHVLRVSWHGVRERKDVVNQLPDLSQELPWVGLVA